MHKANISVIIPCYNMEKYLGECVESVKSQTVLPKEIIVVHDGCQKPTAFTETTTVFREENLGVARTRDQGVQLSAQPFLLFLDADDTLPELFVQEMMATAAKGADISYPDALLWARWGESEYRNGWFGAPKRITPRRLMVKNEIVVSSLLKRKVYDAVGGFNPELPLFEDYDFWLKALAKGFRFAKANTYLKYRQRTGSRNRKPDEVKRRTYRYIQSGFRINRGRLVTVKRPSHLEKLKLGRLSSSTWPSENNGSPK